MVLILLQLHSDDVHSSQKELCVQKSCQTGLSWAGDESWQAGSRPVAKAVWEERLLQAPLCGGCQTGANMSKPCQLLLPPKKKCLLMGCVGSWSWKGPGGRRERVRELGRAQAGGAENQGKEGVSDPKSLLLALTLSSCTATLAFISV